MIRLGASQLSLQPKPKTLLGITDLGRVASHFYIHHETIESLFNDNLRASMTDAQLFGCLGLAKVGCVFFSKF